MSGSGSVISNELEFKAIIDELEELLKQQLGYAQKGDIAELELLAVKANGLVECMSESQFINEPRFAKRRGQLQELYGQICLALSAQMDDVSQSLGRIYKGKKTVSLYRDNL